MHTSACLSLGALGVAAATALAACGSSNGSTSGSTSSASSASVASSVASSGAGGAGGSSANGGGGAGGAGGAGGGCVSGLVQPSPACQACQDAHCCETATSAATKPGVWTKSAAKICREANCVMECGVAEPICGGIVPDPANCVDAFRAKCCNELTDCAKSDACVAIIYLCIDDQGCVPGQPCFQACLKKYADGAPIFDKVDQCRTKVVCP